MSRRRRKKQENDAHLERWLISYADFITLLFAFFVVMYAISSVNEGKYRVLSDTLNIVFESRSSSPSPIEFDAVQTPVTPRNNLLVNIPFAERSPFMEDEINSPGEGQNDKNLFADNLELDVLSEEVTEALQSLIDDDLINIKKTDYWLEIDIKSSILFSSGGAELSEDAEEVLSIIAGLLNTYPNDLQVEGFTDDRPINSKKFPSNWELSSARAASVVHLFEEEGVNPKRMQAIGYSQYRPIAENTTADGRNKNRRVNLVVLAQGDPRKIMQQRSKSLKTFPSESQNPLDNKQQEKIFNPIFEVQ